MIATGLIRSSKRNSFFTVSTLLTALLAASFVVLVGESPARAAACSSGVMPSGNGQSATPYLIATPQNLIWMSEQTANWNNQHFLQTASIDLEGCQFTPIGKNTSAHFKGTYDGGGFTISGLYIRETTTYAGLFGDMNETAVFKNIGLVDVDIETTGTSAGALAGRLTGNNARVFNSYSTGRVVGGDWTGGLVGVLWGGGNISNSYSTASVTISANNGRGGGLVGGVVTSGAVTNVYAAGPVLMASGFSSTSIGGLIGFPGQSVVQPTETAAFFDSDVSALSNSIGTSKTTAEMNTLATFSSAWEIFDGWEAFNFSTPTNFWGICPAVNNGYPFLLWEYATDACYVAPPPPPPPSSGSSGPSMPMPTADVAAISLSSGPGNGSVVRIELTQTPSAFDSLFVVVRLLDFSGRLLEELRVPVFGNSSALEVPINRNMGQFNVVALTSNAVGATTAVSVNPQTVKQPNIRKATETAPKRLTGKSLKKDVVFTADSAALSPLMKRTLRQAARLAKASDSRVAVTGFAAASPKGTKFEKRLAERRALRVANFLRKQGLENWMYFHGLNSRKGSDFPGQPRRVEIRVLK